MDNRISREGHCEIVGMSREYYGAMCKEASSGTKLYKTLPKAFMIGGLICLLGQCIFTTFKGFGLTDSSASLGVSVTLIFLSALLTGLGLYEKIAKHGGAGTLVPITGFANSVAAPALEFKTEGWVTGLGAKIFIICGPVILYGTLASMAYGIVYYFISR